MARYEFDHPQYEFDHPQDVCPICGSEDIQENDAPNDYKQLEVACYDCDTIWMEPAETLICNLCHNETDANKAHLHQDRFVGECCWDERLRTTE